MTVLLVALVTVGVTALYGFGVGLAYEVLCRYGGRIVRDTEDLAAGLWPVFLVGYLVWAIAVLPARWGGRLVDAIHQRATSRTQLPTARVVSK